jgi:hypothetical protein
MPEDIIVGSEPAARDADEMKATDFQMLKQSVEIFRDGAGLRAGGWIRRTATPAAPVKSDGAISGFDESGDVVLKTIGIARVGVEQHDRNASAAAVRVPETHTGEIYVTRDLCSRCHDQKRRREASARSPLRNPCRLHAHCGPACIDSFVITIDAVYLSNRLSNIAPAPNIGPSAFTLHHHRTCLGSLVGILCPE